MKNWYYENRLDLSDFHPEMVEVDWIYCLRFDLFTSKDWDTLNQIYASLPSPQGENGVVSWFGTEEEHPPYLFPSVEPSGLQIVGSIALEDWINWDTEFRKKVEASSLPTFEV